MRRQALIALLVCAPTLALFALAFPVLFDFPTGVAERLALVLRADLVVALWVVIAIRMVSKVRFTSQDDNAGSAFGPPSARLAVPAAFLQNTLEQAFIAVVGHLALATVNGEAPLAYVLGSVALFSLGRVTFLAGYRRGAGGRAFGIVTTALPTIGAYAWVLAAMVADLIGSM